MKSGGLGPRPFLMRGFFPGVFGVCHLVVGLALLLGAVSHANAALPALFQALRTGAGVFGLTKLVDEGAALVGRQVQELDVALQPMTDAVQGFIGNPAVRIPLTAATPVPAPNAAATVALATPGTSYYCLGATYYEASCGLTGEEACAKVAASSGGTNPVLISGYACYYTGGTGSPKTISYPVLVRCPPGYSQGATECTLLDARKATDDKQLDFHRTGTTLAPYASEYPSNMTAFLSQQTISSVNDTVYISGLDGDIPTRFRVTARPDGGSIIGVEQQKTDGSGGSYLRETTVGVAPNGTVESVAATNQNKQLVADASGTQLTPQTVSAPTYSPVPTSGTGQAASFPNDYARMGESMLAAQKVVDKLDTALKVDDTGFIGKYMGPAGSAHDQQMGQQKSLIEGMETPGITWADWMPSLLPGSAVACHPIEFRGAVNVGPAAGLDSTTYLDLCPYLELARQILGWLFGVGSVIYIWRRFAGARGGAV